MSTGVNWRALNWCLSRARARPLDAFIPPRVSLESHLQIWQSTIVVHHFRKISDMIDFGFQLPLKPRIFFLNFHGQWTRMLSEGYGTGFLIL